MKAWLRELGLLTSEESTKVITEENFNENKVDELVCGPKLRFYEGKKFSKTAISTIIELIDIEGLRREILEAFLKSPYL